MRMREHFNFWLVWLAIKRLSETLWSVYQKHYELYDI